MTSSMNNNRCKLLILDLDTSKISIDNLRTYFSLYGPIEWIETFPGKTSAIIYFVSYLTVDHLIKDRTCLIGQNNVRLRRLRFDENNWHIDSHTLHVKFSTSVYPTNLLTETTLRFCFRKFESNITKIDILDNNHALISFSSYDYVDQILLLPSSMFIINGISLVFERMMEKIRKKSRWDQSSTPLANVPILSVRNPVVYKLMSHIEYLTKQLSEQPAQSRNEIERLEAEVFILKNENARLKSKENMLEKKNFEQRLTVLEDISNKILHTQSHNHYRQRERSPSPEKQSKRRRKYEIIENSLY